MKERFDEKYLKLGATLFLTAVAIILFYFIVKLLNPFLHSKVLSKPNEKINEEEDDDIACYSQKAMRHPVHTISNRQH